MVVAFILWLFLVIDRAELEFMFPQTSTCWVEDLEYCSESNTIKKPSFRVSTIEIKDHNNKIIKFCVIGEYSWISTTYMGSVEEVWFHSFVTLLKCIQEQREIKVYYEIF